MVIMHTIFKDQIISCPLWPAHSPDLKPCNYYLWKSSKDSIYKTNTHTA